MLKILIILILLPIICYSQFFDDFSDGDFLNNPQWTGDIEKFIINQASQLQLYDTTRTSPSFLSTESTAINETSWEFFVKFGFNPSSSNYSNIYLVSNNANFNEPLEAYFVMIGNTSRNISLYRQDGSSVTKIIEGTNNRLNTSNVNVRVLVTRDNTGNWELYSDTLGGRNYYYEGGVFDNTYTHSSYFGIKCFYTTTRWNLFYFDEFIVADKSIIPKIVSYELLDDNKLVLNFNKILNESSALNNTNYHVNNDIGNPFKLSFQNIVKNQVLLEFQNSFDRNKTYNLSYKNIRDIHNNLIISDSFDFLYFVVEHGMIIISEIMSKPYPVVQLPDVEYVELFNRTDFDIELTGWTFTASNTSRSLPYCVIKAKSYLVLCHESKKHLFGSKDNVVGVSGFPTLANTGTSLILQDENEQYIHTVTYSDRWFTENFKKEGGWSLEIIDTDNICEEKENWRESIDKRGGTPGEKNSVSAVNPDLTLPYPIAAEALSEDTVIVWFSEILLKEHVENTDNFYISEFGNPVWISAKPPRFSEIKMKFNAKFETGKVYYLNFLNDIKDCSGNKVERNTSIRFGIADSVVNGDLVINEILFNAPVGAGKFVEIYNKSNKLLDLKKLWISNRNSVREIANSRPVSEKSRLLLPNEYCVLTTDIQSIIDNYFVLNTDAMFETTSLPSFPITEGTVVITDRYFNIIDEVSYHQNQHYRLLADVKGVSLERINYERESSDPNNWHSAAQSAGFATPGYKNSQYVDNVSPKSFIKVYPEVFSPDNDGVDDILNIAYQFDEPGYTITMAIYSSNGRFIKYIAQNVLVGTEGYFYWDGFDNKDIICPIGIYIVYAEMFSLSGNKKAEKHVFVLSKRTK